MPSPPLTILQPLSPRVAVLCTDEVTRSCEANGCRGLEELLRPWEGGTERVSVLSSTLTPTVHPTFPLRFVTFSSVFPNPGVAAPLPDMVVDMISSYVGDRRPEEEQQYPLARSLLLASRPTAAHETFNHPVSVLFAVSSTEPDPLAAMKRLVQQHIGVAQTIPWLDAVNLLKFFVVVHDVSQGGEDLGMANELLASVKKAHGLHSSMLVMNSKPRSNAPPPSPDVHTHPSIPLPRPLTPADASHSAISQIYASALSSLTLSPMAAAAEAMGEASISNTPASPSQPIRRKLYGSKLSAEDTQRLAALVRELVVQSLVPWMEARVREWNETYHANRRGITGRLFGAGRKFFGSRPASPAPNAAAAGYNTVKGYYPIAAIEALTRRLADFAFMLRDYRFASGVYDSLRRDFAQDRALRYSAAATEMYGLSLLLSNPYFLPSNPPRTPSAPFTTLQHTDISSWLEQAVMAYYGSGQGIQLDALRATVLYYESWKMIGEWRGVGAALVRAAGDAEEVVGAVMIEEAAQADLRGGKDPNGRGKRRRAFNLVMAGRRYETAGLKSYSRRCLTRAAEIYRSTPWTAVKDRIEYSLGRQAYASGDMKVAVEHFLTLLGRDDTGVPESQGGPLQDMELAYEQLASRPDELKAVEDSLQLPTPIFDVKQTRINTPSSIASSSRSGAAYAEVEAMALAKWDRKGKKPMRLLPGLFRVTVDAGETFHVELSATNPLNATLVLSSLTLAVSSSNLDIGQIEIETIPEITLGPHETRLIPLELTVPSAGQVTVESASFLFSRCLPCSQSLQKRGKRLHATKEQRLNATYGTDTSLEVTVAKGGPRIHAELHVSGPERGVLSGESRHVDLRLRNDGKLAVENVDIWLDQPGVLRSRRPSSGTPHDGAVSVWNRLNTSHTVDLRHISLDPGEETVIPLALSSDAAGPLSLSGLVLCSATDNPDQISCSTVAIDILVRPAVDISARVRPMSESGGYLILVEAYNRSSVAIQLDGLMPVSQYWAASPLRLDSVIVLPNQAYRIELPVQVPEQTPEGVALLQAGLIDGLSALVQGRALPADPIAHANFPVSGAPDLGGGSNFDHEAYTRSREKYRSVYLKASFPTLSPDQLFRLFPLVDPLDLDLVLSWSIPDSDRHGQSSAHALRPAPDFSIIGPIQETIAQALLSGNKQTRTMYEETGRLRRVLVDSVLEGVLAREEDPVSVRLKVQGVNKGVVARSFDKGLERVEVALEVRNRSPVLPVRWILRLPSNSHAVTGDRPPLAVNTAAAFTGRLYHTGTLEPHSAEMVICSILVTEPGPMSLDGWDLQVETGDRVGEEYTWTPRKSWTRTGSGGAVQVVKA